MRTSSDPRPPDHAYHGHGYAGDAYHGDAYHGHARSGHAGYRAAAVDPLAWLGRPAGLALAALCGAAILLARCPTVLTHPSFWAEDGWAWYPDAYTDGWASLARPLAGYLQSVSRLVALAAQLAPLAWAPSLFTLAALAVQVAPAVLLVSDRLSDAWPCRWARLVFALVMLAQPNSRETYVNLTNAQWHLAVLAFLLLVSNPPRSWRGALCEVAALALSGLSGPLCVLLAAVAVWRWAVDRSRASLWRAGIVLACAVIQGGVLAATMHERSPATLGADAGLLTRIIAVQIVLGALIGGSGALGVTASPVGDAPWLPGAAIGVAGVLSAVALIRGLALLRVACAFAALLIAAALAHPQIVDMGAQWPEMARPGVGERYYIIPMLAWTGVLFTLAADRSAALRVVAIALLATMAVGVSADWRLPEIAPSGFVARAEAFARAPAGTRMEFPVRSPAPWRGMSLVRRP